MKDYTEIGFDNVTFIQLGHYSFNMDLIKRLNDINNNFDPFIIEDFFIEYFDNGLINNIKLTKTYSIDKYTASYNIRVNIRLHDAPYTPKSHKLKENLFTIDCPEILNILDKYYGHYYTNDAYDEMFRTRVIDGRSYYTKKNYVFKLFSKNLYWNR